MNEVKHPLPGQVWVKANLRREIVSVKVRGWGRNDYDVIWRRPDMKKEFTIWLPYWNRWSKGAHLTPL